MSFQHRLQHLATHPAILVGIQRGIEKESLRIDAAGRLSQTPHPQTLGSALTHPSITTDYSEALLEFITPVSTSIDDSLNKLTEVHRYVYSQIGEELLWGASMPCILEGDDSIPVAHYGSSNVATMKQVYREGLGHRYGRLMQTISGIHYNFSMPDAYWDLARERDGSSLSTTDYRTEAYFGMIRNFRRYSWLLVYLFGASPAVCRSFLRDSTDHQLTPFDERGKSLHAAYGTSLRMGDLGYQSNAQKNLSVCYNTLGDYVETLHHAITTPHPEYAATGLTKNGKYCQLNTALLQIENEFYSPIRPKRVTESGEPPLAALLRDGVEYIEVRCIDVNPYHPLGIDTEQIRFLDTFLLFCLLSESPACDEAETERMAENLKAVVNNGRKPGLQLNDGKNARSLPDFGAAIVEQLKPIASMLDTAHGGDDYAVSLARQQHKLDNPAATPSAMVLAEMAEKDIPFFRLAMNYSLEWAEQFRADALPETTQRQYREEAAASLARQIELEEADQGDFESFLRSYYQQYDELPLSR